MGSRGLLGALVAVVVAFAAPAHARAPCQAYTKPVFDICARRAMHLVPLSDFSARGDEVIRIFDPAEGPLLVVEAVMPKQGDGTLTAWLDGETILQRIQVLPRTRFAALRTELLRQTGDVARLYGGKPQPRYYGRDDGEICVPDWPLVAEGVIGGRPAFARLDSCELGDGFFVYDVEALVAEIDPYCANLLPAHSEPELAARPCLRLRGDRSRAAGAFRAAQTLGAWSSKPQGQVEHAPDDVEIAATFTPQARIDFHDMPPAVGADAAARTWAALRGAGKIGYKPTDAWAHDGVVDVHGTAENYGASEPEPVYEFGFTQTWRLDADARWRLVSWRFYPMAP